MARSNQVSIDLVIKTLLDDSDNAIKKAEQQGKKYAEAYQRALDAATNAKNNTDMSRSGILDRELLDSVKNLPDIKAISEKIAKLKAMEAKLSNVGNLFDGTFDVPDVPKTPKRSKKNNSSKPHDTTLLDSGKVFEPTINLAGLKKGLEDADKLIKNFVASFENCIKQIQRHANTKIELNGVKEGINKAKNDINTAVGEIKTGFKVKIAPIIEMSGLKDAVTSIKNQANTVDVKINLTNKPLAIKQFESFLAKLQSMADKPINFNGLKNGLNESKKNVSDTVKDIKSSYKVSITPSIELKGLQDSISAIKTGIKETTIPIKLGDTKDVKDKLNKFMASLESIATLKVKLAPDSLDNNLKTAIGNTVADIGKKIGELAKKFDAFPLTIDKAMNKMNTSLVKIQTGMVNLIIALSQFATGFKEQIDKISAPFGNLQKEISKTGKMLRDLGKNTGNNIQPKLKSISDSFKNLDNTIKSFGGGLPANISNALNTIATATGRMASHITKINNMFKNIDISNVDKIKNKIKEAEEAFKKLSDVAKNVGGGTAEKMLSALRVLRNRINLIIRLLREATTEARNFGSALSGSNVSEMLSYQRALSGVYARLKAIARIKMPQMPRIPNAGNGGANGGGSTRRSGGSFTDTNNIYARLQAVSNTLSNALISLANRANSAARSLMQLPEAITNAIVKFNVMYYGLPNIANTLSAPFAPGFEFQSTLEVSKLGIAGILVQMGRLNGEAMDFDTAMRVAEGTFKRLNQAAILTSAQTQELVQTIQGLMAPGFGEGFTLKQIEDYTIAGVNVAKAMGLPSTQYVQELRDMLQGGISSASSQIARSFGLTDAKLKEMRASSKGLYQSLMDLFKGFEGAMKKFPTTFTGMKDQIKEFGTLVSAKFTETFEKDIKFVMSIIQRLFGNIREEADGTKIFEPNPLVVSFFETIGTSVKQMSAIWNQFLSTVGSFDETGGFNVTPKGIELWNSFKKTLGGIWQTVLLITSSIAAASPIFADISIALNSIAQMVLGVVNSGLAATVQYVKYVADNWENVKTKIIEFATEVYNSSTTLNTIVYLVKAMLGIMVSTAKFIGYVADNWERMKPIVVNIATSLIGIWGLVKAIKAATMAVQAITVVYNVTVAGLALAYRGVLLAVTLVQGAVKALAAAQFIISIISRVTDLATAWRFVRLMIYRTYGATKALALADFIINTIKSVHSLRDAWTGVVAIMKQVLTLTKATALWNTVTGVVSSMVETMKRNPGKGLATVAGITLAGGGIAYAVKSVYDTVSDAFDGLGDSFDDFGKVGDDFYEQGKKDLDDLQKLMGDMFKENSSNNDNSDENSPDPSGITSGIPPQEDKKAAEKAEKERLKAEKKALKEMLSALKAGLKDQLDVIKNHLEDIDVLYKQNQIGVGEYSLENAQGQVDQDLATMDSLSKQISAIQNSDSFDNEDDRQNQLNPLIEKYNESKRAYEKHLSALNEIRDMLELNNQAIALQTNAMMLMSQGQAKGGRLDRSSASKLSNEQLVMHYITDIMGRSKEMASVVVGSMLGESGVNPKNSSIDSDGYESFGLMQWHLSRLAELENLANSQGKSRDDIYVQLEHMANEANGAYKSQWDAIERLIQTTGNLDEAQRKFMDTVEVCEFSVDSFNTRMSGTRSALDNFNSGLRITTSSLSGAGEMAVEAGRKMRDEGWKYGTYNEDYKQIQCAQFVTKSWEDSSGVMSALESAGVKMNRYVDDGGWTDARKWVPALVDLAKELQAWHPYGDGYSPKAGDAIVEDNQGHVVMATGNGTDMIHASSTAGAVVERGSYTYNPVGVIDYEAILDKAGLTVGGIINKLSNNILKTQEGIKAEAELNNIRKEARETRTELNAIWGDISKEQLEDLKDTLVQGKYSKRQKFLANGMQEEANATERIYRIKENKLNVSQQKTYLDRAMKYINDNASFMSQKIGQAFLYTGSKISSATYKYLNYFVDGLNYTGGIKGLDLREISNKLHDMAIKAVMEGDSETYFEVKNMMASIRESLISVIDNFQKTIKENADYVNEMVDLTNWSTNQKAMAKRDTDAKLYTQLADSETQKAVQLKRQNATDIEYAKKKMTDRTKAYDDFVNGRKDMISKLDSKSADYEKQKQLLQHDIDVTENNRIKEMAQRNDEIRKLMADTSPAKAFQQAALYMEKARKAASGLLNSLDDIKEASKDAVEDGLVTFLTDGINECETLAEALNNLLVSVLKTIQKKFAENIAFSITDGLFSNGGDKGADKVREQQDRAMVSQTLATGQFGQAQPIEINASDVSFKNAKEVDTSQVQAINANLASGWANAPDVSTNPIPADDGSLMEASVAAQQLGTATETTSTSVSELGNGLTTTSTAIDQFASSIGQASETIMTFINNLNSSLGGGGGAGEEPKAFATGGYISGPGTGTSDSILSRLSNGEFVVKAASVRKYGAAMLERINNGTFSHVRVNIPKFANGGYVGSMAGGISDGFTDRLSQSFNSNVSVTNYVDGNKVVNPEMIKTIVRKVNVQDAKRNSMIARRF